jgi:hypothetical protein
MTMNLKLSESNQVKFVKNLIIFTAPALAVYFGQLALGVNWKAAGLVALLTLYQALADFFKKLQK